MQTPLKYPGLKTQPDPIVRSPFVRSIQRFLRQQFGNPDGIMGTLVGRVLTSQDHRERISWTVALLQIKPHDRVLEVGFGPGLGIELTSSIAFKGVVVGIDHSKLMVRQAGKRNARAIKEGRVVLKLGSASDPPNFDDLLFDKIFTINSIHFWDDPVGCLKKLRPLLRPGGVIALTLQPLSRKATEENAQQIGLELCENLREADFSEIRLECLQSDPVSTVCALGKRSSRHP